MTIRIDPSKPWKLQLDLTDYVKKVEDGYGCTKCADVLIRIEVGGILGETLNQLDTAVILDHHYAKHAP